MLTAEDNRFLTESDAGTPMGELIRRFWVPAILSEEIAEPDGEPKKITVLGEELLAFRDTEGRVGVIDQYCPHRGANLWLGRNEECGIRCVYHGWKFDIHGQCVDMPTSYPDLNAKDGMRIKAYPAREFADIVWVYMGPADRMPALPHMEFGMVAPSHRFVSKKWQDCNWVQALEGSIDTAHFTYTHLVFHKQEDEDLDVDKHLVMPIARMTGNLTKWIATDPRPVIQADPHDAGLVIGGGRVTETDDLYWRIAQNLIPFHTYTPSALPGQTMFGQTFVPFTDGNCWIVCYAGNPERPLTDEERESYANGGAIFAEIDEDYVPLRTKANNYLIDRSAQRTSSYMGIKGVSEQDAAVQDSQGEIADRTREHLGPTDLGIMRFRKLVMDSARALQQGQEPAASAAHEAHRVRSGACITNKSKALRDVMVERFGHPTGLVVEGEAAAE